MSTPLFPWLIYVPMGYPTNGVLLYGYVYHSPCLPQTFSQTKPGLQEQDAEFQFEVVDETHETNPATKRSIKQVHSSTASSTTSRVDIATLWLFNSFRTGK